MRRWEDGAWRTVYWVHADVPETQADADTPETQADMPETQAEADTPETQAEADMPQTQAEAEADADMPDTQAILEYLSALLDELLDQPGSAGRVDAATQTEELQRVHSRRIRVSIPSYGARHSTFYVGTDPRQVLRIKIIVVAYLLLTYQRRRGLMHISRISATGELAAQYGRLASFNCHPIS